MQKITSMTKKQLYLNVFIILIFLGVVLYVGIRSSSVPFTHDEAANYSGFIRGGILPLFNIDEASNHFLNTWLEKISFVFFGNHEFTLRLPSFAGLFIFLISGFFSLGFLKRPLFKILGAAILVLNPYVLDFFSLARGYGLALGCLSASIYHALRAWRDHDNSSLAKALLWAGLATLANLTFLNVFVALCVVFFVHEVVIQYREAVPPRNVSFRPSRRLYVFGVVSFVFLFFLGFLNSGFHFMSLNKMADPVLIQLNGISAKERDGISVSRVRPKQVELDPIVFNSDKDGYFTEYRYYKAIDIVLSSTSMKALTSIHVAFGNLDISTQRDKLATNWDVSQLPSGGIHLVSKASMSLKKSRLPVVNDIINWGGDSLLLKRTLVSAFETAALGLVIAMFLFAVYRVLTASRILSTGTARPLFGISLILFILFFIPITNLKNMGTFYSGGSQGFLSNTVGSLVGSTLYDRSYAPRAAPFLKDFVLIASAVAVLWALWKIRTRAKSTTVLFLLLIFVIAAEEVLQFYILKTPYVMGRYALFFLPIYSFFLIFFLEEASLDSKQPFSVSIVVFAALLAVLQVFHFAESANLKYVLEWRFDAGTKSLLRTLDENPVVKQRTAEGKQVRLGLFWNFHPTLRYYLEKSPRQWLLVDYYKTNDVHEMLFLHNDYDFLYVDDIFPVDSAGVKYHVVEKFPESVTYLLAVDQTPAGSTK